MIILLMGAGAGSRFVQDGHTTPKPFIDVDGFPMYEYVASRIGLDWISSDDNIYFVTQLAYKKYVESVDIIENLFVPDLVKAGPAWTAVAATLDCPEHSDLLIFDSDCFVQTDESTQYDLIRDYPIPLTTEAVVFTVKAKEDNPDVAMVDFGRIMQIREGGVLEGQQINVGAYWFRSVGKFRRSVFYAQQEQESSAELKLSEVMNTQLSAEACELNGEFINLGSPTALEAYKRKKCYGKTE
jgi:hypothetical protein